MTIQKLTKRMKLLFSTTVPTAVFASEAIKILPDFEVGGFDEIDGCGLISKRALNMVWREYQEKNFVPKEKQTMECRYSGFQGRLGGFKGTWVLDPSLEGIQVQCRKSQEKFKTNEAFLEKQISQRTDDAFESCRDTSSIMEVCSWDKWSTTTLNHQVIQRLEDCGVPWDFFEKHILEPELDVLSQILSPTDGDNFWRKRLQRAKAQSFRGKALAMYHACVPSSDPEFTRLKKKIVELDFINLRDKAHYPLNGCAFLRMYADHTLLLEEGEAFIACDDNELLEDGEYILAMRFPAYFAGDLRRLKRVTLKQLMDRSYSSIDPDLPQLLRRSPEEKIAFFRGLKNCTVLCNKGKRSEADKMSGGDYDGDQAFISWNRELMSALSTNPREAEDTHDIQDTPSITGQKNAWEHNSVWNQVSYVLEARHHKELLAKLAEGNERAIDREGFDSNATKRLGDAAFLQVDCPDTPRMKSHEIDRLRQIIGTPDWKLQGQDPENVKGSYESKRILGRLYRKIKHRMKHVINGFELLPEKCGLPDKIQKIIDQVMDYFSENSVEYFENSVEYFEKESRDMIEKYMEDRVDYISNKPNADGRVQQKNRQETQRAIDEFYEWKEGKMRNLKVQPKLHLPVPDSLEIHAAICYKTGLELEEEYRARRKNTDFGVQNPNTGGPMECVWGIYQRELLRIFAGPDGVTYHPSRVE